MGRVRVEVLMVYIESEHGNVRITVVDIVYNGNGSFSGTR